MGIRFACHACQKSLNIKSELAGKRGVCPQCGVRFRIPSDQSAESHPVDEPEVQTAPMFTAGNVTAHKQTHDHPSAPASKEPLAPPTESSNFSSASLLDDPVAVWYVRPPSGGQYGPANGELLRAWIAESRVTASSFIWRDGWPQWRVASEALAELTPAVPPHRSSPRLETASPTTVATPDLTGDATIGTRKSRLTHRRIVIVGSLTALSLLLIGLLVILVQRS